jgi:hypothetical protein
VSCGSNVESNRSIGEKECKRRESERSSM